MRKILSLVLALALSMLCIIPAAAANTQFSDVPASHWAYASITKAAGNGLVKGYADGTFRPNNPITNAEFITMAAPIFVSQSRINEEAAKLGSGAAWYMPVMKASWGMFEHTSFGGDPNNWAAAANQPIMRSDAAIIGTYCYQGDGGPSGKEEIDRMTDLQQVDADTHMFISDCLGLGVMSGYPDNTFRPNGTLTRAEACAVVDRMARAYNGEDLSQTTTQPAQPQQPQQTEQTGSTLANGQAITEANVLAIIDQVRREYPTGTIWGYDTTPNTKYYAAGNKSTDVRAVTNKFKCKDGYSALDTQYGCGGFMAMVSDRIFGQTGFPAREVTDPGKIRPGDLCLQFNSEGLLTHVSIVTETLMVEDGDGVTRQHYKTSSGNIGRDSNRIIQWSHDVSGYYGVASLGNNHVYTRYPD